VCVTDGASGALALALWSILAAGDEVIMPEIGYPVFGPLAKLIGVDVRYAPMGEDGIYDFDWLERALTPRTRCILVNTPSNPLGAFWSSDQLQRLASLGIPVVSDEVYGMLSYSGIAPSMAQVTPDCMVVGSFSKAFALPGIRVGYLVIPERYVDKVNTLKRHLNFSTSIPSQLHAQRALTNAHSLLAAHRGFLIDRRTAFERLVPMRRSLQHSRAGFFGLIDVSSIEARSGAIALALARRCNLGMAPGIDFVPKCEVTSQSDALRLGRFLRMNFAVTDAELALASTRLDEFFRDVHRNGIDGWIAPGGRA
jgi:aspartate/methionine/tyrosine aminotransferase